MKFTEFVRKNHNVITGTRSTRISESIPISEDREKFYSDEQFTKYDVVESEGKKLRILEKCSNYYACVDESGNVVRKFAKALTLTEDTTPMWRQLPMMFHGYTPSEAFQESDQCAKFMVKLYELNEESDDIALLKELKEADQKVLRESMETDYKLRDKLTIAKLIADAVGIPHDPLSTPENLVNAAIRKARKDPALMRNKAVLANMLEIAKSVGIKFSDSTFEVKKEVDEGVNHSDLAKLAHDSYVQATRQGNGTMAAEYLKQHVKHKEAAAKEKKNVKEDVLNEDPLNAWKNRMKAAGAVHYISGKHVSGTTASKLHAYKIVDGKKVKVGAFDQVGRRGIAEDTVDESLTKEYHHRMYLKAIKLGNGALAKHHAQIRDSLKEDTLDELKEDYYFYGRKSFDRFKAKAEELHGPITAGKKQDGVTPFHNKAGHRIGRHEIDGEGDNTYHIHNKPIKEDTLDELKKSTVKSYLSGALNNPWDKKVTRDKGLQRHKGVNRALDRLVKEDTLEELNIETVKSYSEKAKTAPAKSMDKAIKRFGGQERAQDRIHKDELKKMSDRLKESEELVEKFGVFRKGGSIGDNKQATPVKVHDTAEDAKAHAKRLNKLLSPGEKNYYGMKYHTKPVSEDSKVPTGYEEHHEVDEGTVTEIPGGIRHTGTKGYGNGPEDDSDAQAPVKRNVLNKKDVTKHKWQDGRTDDHSSMGHSMEPHSAELPTNRRRIAEHIVKHGSGYRLVSKKTGKNLGDFDTMEAAEKHEREVEYFKHQNEEVEPLTLKSLRKKMAGDAPTPDVDSELIPDANTYAAKNKEMMGGEPTDDTPDMPDDNTGMTPDAISFRDIVKKLNATMVPKSEVSTATDKLPHGNAMNPTSDTHRKQLIRKLQGN